MYKYELLYNDLTLLSVNLDNELAKNLQEQQNIKEVINEKNKEIKQYESEKNEKKEIYSTIVNYDKLRKVEFKEAMKDAAVASALTLFLLEVAAFSITIGIDDIFWHGIMGALPVSLAVGEFETVKKYLERTKNIRKIYKKYGNSVYARPVMINFYDKAIQIAYEEIDDLNIELQGFIDEERYLNAQIEKCNKFLDYLEEKIPEINHICRNDQECINDVYNADLEVKEALKLVRERREI